MTMLAIYFAKYFLGGHSDWTHGLSAENWLYVVIAIVSVSMIICFFVAMVLERKLVDPILSLARTMEAIKDSHDLTLRVDYQKHDEIGLLADSFNEMLNIIYDRQLELEIVYQELIQESKKADKASAELEMRNQQIQEMLNGAAHDLRQPLQAMKIFVETLNVKNKDDSLNSIIDKLHNATKNLNDLFTDILDVSRLDNYHRDKTLVEMKVNDLFEKLRVEFSALAKGKKLDFRIRKSDAAIWSTPRFFERVLRNILSNAINYTDGGGVLLAQRRIKGNIVIDIWDTGRGISHENLQRVFEQYERVEQTAEEKQAGEKSSGYGLGLAIVKQFLDFMGYEVEVASIEGQGTRFRIVIPQKYEYIEGEQAPEVDNLEVEDDNTEDEEQSEYYDYEHLQIMLEKTNVLFVDDEKEIRIAFRELCHSWGMGVETFSDIDKMSAYFNSGDFVDPDIIISDYQLKNGVTGDEVIEEARLLSGVNIPAFIITGNRNKRILNNIESKGFEYMLKPVEPSELKEKIESYLG